MDFISICFCDLKCVGWHKRPGRDLSWRLVHGTYLNLVTRVNNNVARWEHNVEVRKSFCLRSQSLPRISVLYKSPPRKYVSYRNSTEWYLFQFTVLMHFKVGWRPVPIDPACCFPEIIIQTPSHSTPHFLVQFTSFPFNSRRFLCVNYHVRKDLLIQNIEEWEARFW